jgi:hypothetical protein
MGTAAIIVIGLVTISVIAVVGDVVSKIFQARIKSREAAGGPGSVEIERLKGRLASLESRLDERDESVRKLQDELRFVSRMLEDKSSRGS